MASKLLRTAVLLMIAPATLADVHAGSIMGEVKFTDVLPQLKPVKVSNTFAVRRCKPSQSLHSDPACCAAAVSQELPREDRHDETSLSLLCASN